MDKTERLARILSELQLHRRITASELADRLGVSARTIYRDMDTLAAAGVPLRALPGLDGGYGLADGEEQKPVLLSPVEALALSLGAAITAAMPVPALAAAATRASERLQSLAASAADWPAARNQYIASELSPSGHVHPVLQAVLGAMVEGRQVVLFSWGGGAHCRVEPFGLTCCHGVWYVIGQSPNAARPARFPLAAIKDAEASPRPASRCPASLDDVLAGQKAADSPVDPRFVSRVRLRLADSLAGVVRESPMMRDVRWEQHPTGWEVVVDVDDPALMLRLAWEQADRVEILEPASWRQLLELRARACLDRYGDRGELPLPARLGAVSIAR